MMIFMIPIWQRMKQERTIRKKYRIRFYNGALDFIRLEKKIKYRGMTKKIVQKLSREESDFLLYGEQEKWQETISI